MPARRSGLEADELLRAVVSNAPVVLFALDEHGVFTLAEGRGLDALGRKPGQAVGQSVFDLYKDNPKIVENCRRALAGETVTAIVPVGPLAFETRYTPRLDWGGKVTGVIGVATDVTDFYRALLARDEFLSVISHELRTPLSSATGWAWLLREGELSDAQADKALATVCRNLDDLKRLLSELRDASQAATGRLRLTPRPCDLGATVRAAAKSLSAAIEAKALLVDVSAPALRAVADKSRVRQLVWILLSNAIKFSPKGGAVEVRLERRDGDALLTVADRGPGIAAERSARIFDIGRAPDDAEAPRGRGLGLGLAIARRLAELHGGEVGCAPRPDGPGTVFTARLPLK